MNSFGNLPRGLDLRRGLGVALQCITPRHPARYISPFFYAVGDNQLQHGLPLAWAGILIVTTAVFALAAVVAFNRLDVH
jgi:hypothetical protein